MSYAQLFILSINSIIAIQKDYLKFRGRYARYDAKATSLPLEKSLPLEILHSCIIKSISCNQTVLS